MAVQTYSMRTDANTNVSEHFKVREFACNDGSDTVLIDDDLVTRLERIRGVFGSGITITSGYRTPSYNAAVGGATSSQHVKGTAADIQLRGVPPLAVANYVEETFTTGGIGVYRTFTHVDVRSRRVIWKIMARILPLLREHRKVTGKIFKMVQTPEEVEKAAEENPEQLTSR